MGIEQGLRVVALLSVGFVIPEAAHANVIISSAATQNMSCSGDVCAPTATDAVLNVTDLENLLASGNVEVTTTGSEVQARNVEINAPPTWSDSSGLTLDAYESVHIEKPVAVSGSGGLSVVTNDGGNGGSLSFSPKGNVTFQHLSSSLTINGTDYALVNALARLAHNVAINPNGDFALAKSINASRHGAYTSRRFQPLSPGASRGLATQFPIWRYRTPHFARRSVCSRRSAQAAR
jgi:hypothetical protein